MTNEKSDKIVVGSNARLIAEIRKAHKAGALNVSVTDELVKLLRHPPRQDDREVLSARIKSKKPSNWPPSAKPKRHSP